MSKIGESLNNKTEYMVYFWGGAWNKDANPSIKDELNIENNHAYYFNEEKEMKDFIDKVTQPKYKDQGIVFRTRSGVLKHKNTIFVGTYQYKNKQFTLEHDFGADYEEEHAEHIMVDGNMACDCNISMLAREQYGEAFMPELGCGFTIELLEHHFEYR